MSRRSRRRERQAGAAPQRPRVGPQAERSKQERPQAERPQAEPSEDNESRWAASRLGPQLVLLAVVFAVAVLVAELFGAANLGVAFGVGQIAFAITVVYLMLRR